LFGIVLESSNSLPQVAIWNNLRVGLLTNRLVSFEKKYHPSLLPSTSCLNVPSATPSTEVPHIVLVPEVERKLAPKKIKEKKNLEDGSYRDRVTPNERRQNMYNPFRLYLYFMFCSYGYVIRPATPQDVKNILLYFQMYYFYLSLCISLSDDLFLLFHYFTQSYREYVEKYKSVRSYVKKCSQSIKSSFQG